MEKIPLSLESSPNAGGGPGMHGAPRAQPANHPVMGYFAIGFGILGIFTHGWIFTPMGLLCSIIALFVGQVSWAMGGLFLSVIGLLTSPILLALIGLGVFHKQIAAWFQWLHLPWF